MVVHFGNTAGCKSRDAFTLMEVLIGFFIFGLVTAGMIYGYTEANRMAEWSAMSLGAQSYALQGLEQARAAQWDTQKWPASLGDWLPAPTNYSQVDTNDIPQSGAPLLVTNYISVTWVTTNPPLRQIRSDVVWAFRLTGQPFTNTVISLRAPDQ